MNDTLQQLIELLDTALTSKDPAIREALKKLLFIVTLTIANDAEDKVEGPLAEIFRRMDALERGQRQNHYNQNPWTTDTIYRTWTGDGTCTVGPNTAGSYYSTTRPTLTSNPPYSNNITCTADWNDYYTGMIKAATANAQEVSKSSKDTI
jgi:hypothetical protein